jgi:hypothetical protein
MCDQVRQHLEDFGLQRHHVSFAVQLMCLGVQSTHAKAVDHGLSTYGINVTFRWKIDKFLILIDIVYHLWQHKTRVQKDMQ